MSVLEDEGCTCKKANASLLPLPCGAMRMPQEFAGKSCRIEGLLLG